MQILYMQYSYSIKSLDILYTITVTKCAVYNTIMNMFYPSIQFRSPLCSYSSLIVSISSQCNFLVCLNSRRSTSSVYGTAVLLDSSMSSYTTASLSDLPHLIHHPGSPLHQYFSYLFKNYKYFY